MAKAEKAPDAEVWWQGLRWVEAVRMQADRFEEALHEQHRALLDARMRHRLNDGSEQSRSWREGTDRNSEAHAPDRPIHVPSWSLHMQVATELDLLIVTVRNVMRAQEHIPALIRPKMSGQEILELLRNVAEHYDEVGGRSAPSLEAEHPEVELRGIAYTKKETWIGGRDGIPLSRIQAWLGRVWDALVASLAEAGHKVPSDLMASMVEGDDELPWPHERLTYHWSIPRVEEQQWPREYLPSEVAALLAEMFARRRARDPED